MATELTTHGFTIDLDYHAMWDHSEIEVERVFKRPKKGVPAMKGLFADSFYGPVENK